MPLASQSLYPSPSRPCVAPRPLSFLSRPPNPPRLSPGFPRAIPGLQIPSLSLPFPLVAPRHPNALPWRASALPHPPLHLARLPSQPVPSISLPVPTRIPPFTSLDSPDSESLPSTFHAPRIALAPHIALLQPLLPLGITFTVPLAVARLPLPLAWPLPPIALL